MSGFSQKTKPQAGVVEALYVAPARGAPMREADPIRAVAGWGLEGDRYWGYSRKLSRDPARACAITLIAMEALDAAAREYGLDLSAVESRRNVATRGVDLDGLVGREFTVGEAVLRGLMPCEPCTHLAKLTGKAVLRPLVHRGGLRAEIVAGGLIRTGDPVRLMSGRGPGPGDRSVAL